MSTHLNKTRFLTIPSFARRFLVCIPTYEQTAGHFIIVVRKQYIAEVQLLVYSMLSYSKYFFRLSIFVSDKNFINFTVPSAYVVVF